MKNLFKLASMLLFFAFGLINAQNKINMPNQGETIELEGNAFELPSEFNNFKEDAENPCTATYSSNGNEALSIDIRKNAENF